MKSVSKLTQYFKISQMFYFLLEFWDTVWLCLYKILNAVKLVTHQLRNWQGRVSSSGISRGGIYYFLFFY